MTTSNRALAKTRGVSETAIRKAEKAGRIRRAGDGSWDPAQLAFRLTEDRWRKRIWGGQPNPSGHVGWERIRMNLAVVNEAAVAEKDLPLREDIRLLGKILGDTVRDQEGDTVFGLVEGIRQTSVRFHRDEDETARRELEGMLNGLSPKQTTRIIRPGGRRLPRGAPRLLCRRPGGPGSDGPSYRGAAQEHAEPGGGSCAVTD